MYNATINTNTGYNTLKPRQDGRNFGRRHFQMQFRQRKCFHFNISISLNFVPEGPIDNKTSLVQVMAWRLIGDKPLQRVQWWRSSMTQICVTRPHWVNNIKTTFERNFYAIIVLLVGWCMYILLNQMITDRICHYSRFLSYCDQFNSLSCMPCANLWFGVGVGVGVGGCSKMFTLNMCDPLINTHELI